MIKTLRTKTPSTYISILISRYITGMYTSILKSYDIISTYTSVMINRDITGAYASVLTSCDISGIYNFSADILRWIHVRNTEHINLTCADQKSLSYKFRNWSISSSFSYFRKCLWQHKQLLPCFTEFLYKNITNKHNKKKAATQTKTPTEHFVDKNWDQEWRKGWGLLVLRVSLVLGCYFFFCFTVLLIPFIIYVTLIDI